MKYFVLCVVLIFWMCVLTGCAKKPDPVSSINDEIQQGVAELVDYANNNMVMDSDKQFLLNGARECAKRANGLQKQHQTLIESCELKTDKAKAERNTLALILILLVGIKLFNIRL